MGLIIGFVELLGGIILLASGISGASLADTIKGHAAQAFASEEANAGASPGGGNIDAAAAAAGGPAAGTKVNTTGYTNPLQHVTHWERTDQGVDATMPVGAPIVAPAEVKILGVEPNWYSGQPFIYWQILSGPDKGKVQYVAEQITNLAPVDSVLQAGQAIARYASSGTGIEFGWATSSGQTLAQATTGYTEGYATAAGRDMRRWLNSLGAGAGTGAGLSIGAGPDLDDTDQALAQILDAQVHRITTPGYVYTP